MHSPVSNSFDLTSRTTALLTDKYEFTMLDAALKSGVAHLNSTFELFARKLPAGRRYGVVGGTGRAIEAVKNFHFSNQEIEYLKEDPNLSSELLEYLKNYRFKGSITAYPEGELFFPNSPVLTVDATFGEAVLLETVLLSILNHDSAVAAAASRMVVAADGKPVLEMGSRRTHEGAAVAAARVSFIAGFKGTSNLEAGRTYGVPVFGTSAHAFTLAHTSEIEAFKAQVAALGVGTTLLVDTYDTPQGIRNAVEVAGPELGAIRIDSGDDFYEEATSARALLDSLGAFNTKITISSDLDEFVIDDLVERRAPIDSYGAGTRVVTGSGSPTAGMVYKLVAIDDGTGTMRSVAKNAHGKTSVGGRKCAWRILDSAGFATHEKIVVRHANFTYESSPDARALQVVHIKDGQEIFASTLTQSRARHKAALSEIRPSDKAVSAGSPAVRSLN